MLSCLENNSRQENNLSMNLNNQFEEWVKNINSNEKIENNIKAFNFGLFETENGYTMYLIGAKEYKENDDDWATVVDFEPTDKYFEMDKSIIKDKDWKEVLKLSTDLVSDYVKSKGFENSFLKNAEVITVGFDDGDLIRIK
ncbi:hypothetical protein SAMN05444363_0581 [Flavobacterium terrae]|uniref:Uncharacterized protein n=2 Tax=Flavobacterium terrae TaxID=415425 RepID=A0A1M6B6T6_9FLAO|nr:hypothetical protein SAMN05444363_0581 [Flavobacterium terrae]